MDVIEIKIRLFCINNGVDPNTLDQTIYEYEDKGIFFIYKEERVYLSDIILPKPDDPVLVAIKKELKLERFRGNGAYKYLMKIAKYLDKVEDDMVSDDEKIIPLL